MEWVVLASRVEAKILTNTDDGSLKSLKTLHNPIGRLKNKSLQSDKAGLGRARLNNSGVYSLTAEKDPHEEAASKFSRRLADYLKSQWNINHGLTFKVIAEPHFSGMIKRQFSNSKILDQITWLEKDLQNVPTSKWPKILGLEKIPMNVDMKAS
jgi:hypothetical protein